MEQCSIFHIIFKYMIFQRHQNVLLWSKDLTLCTRSINFIQNFIYFLESREDPDLFAV